MILCCCNYWNSLGSMYREVLTCDLTGLSLHFQLIWQFFTITYALHPFLWHFLSLCCKLSLVLSPLVGVWLQWIVRKFLLPAFTNILTPSLLPGLFFFLPVFRFAAIISSVKHQIIVKNAYYSALKWKVQNSIFSEVLEKQKIKSNVTLNFHFCWVIESGHVLLNTVTNRLGRETTDALKNLFLQQFSFCLYLVCLVFLYCSVRVPLLATFACLESCLSETSLFISDCTVAMHWTSKQKKAPSIYI